MAKEELRMRGIPFETIDIQELGKTAAQVTGREDVKSVPQIYIQGVYVGGYEELLQHFDKEVELNESDECRACEG